MANNIWIKYNKISDTDATVITQNFVPNDPINGIPTAQQSEGVFVDSIPVEEVQVGKYSELHINPITLELSYLYINIPVIPKTEVQINSERIDAMESTLLGLMDLSMM